ncbi:MAG: aldehyde dehydrogenase family protein [Candidatus Sericytochromatia bacterium]|nr:aldehyde dehydrogenase family protein [Candidatus Sericytochromatia bacterium]
MKDIIEGARRAQRAWGELTPAERARRMRPWWRRILQGMGPLAEAIAEETGKPRFEALFHEVLPLLDGLRYQMRQAPRRLRPRRLPLHLALHRRSELVPVPLGVVGIIAPWNFPVAIGIGDATTALLAGNAVVLKPSERTPHATRLVAGWWVECGLDPNLLQVRTGGPEAGQELIAAGPDHIIFTGSVPGGRKVAMAAAERLIPTTLELGGKAPALVCPDADLAETARTLVWGAYANCGQVCASVERVYVPRQIWTPLLEELRGALKGLRPGLDVGRPTMPEAVSRWDAQVADAVARGAQTFRPEADFAAPFYPPTLLAPCPFDARVMQEETFGPLLPLCPVEDVDEAMALANASEVGLLAYVFTRDVAAGRHLAAKLEVGTVMINEVILSHAMPETPWGGQKDSGWGRVHGEQGLDAVVHWRHVNSPGFTWRLRPWVHPYEEEWMRLAERWLPRIWRV